MNKNEFLTTLSGRLPYSKDEVSFMLDIMADVIADGLKYGDQVRTPLGVFKKVQRKSRKIRDISSGRIRVLPAWEQVEFEPSKKINKE